MLSDRSTEETTAPPVDLDRHHFPDGGPGGGFDESSPLVETGVLTPLNAAVLPDRVRSGLGATLAPDRITRQTFQEVRGIGAALTATGPQAAEPGREGPR